MRAVATGRLRVRTDYFAHKGAPVDLGRFVAALRGADERPRRALTHLAIVGVAVSTALASICFNV